MDKYDVAQLVKVLQEIARALAAIEQQLSSIKSNMK